VLRTYTGFKIPADALRTIDGQTGVYVLIGVQAKFKRVQIMYSVDNYKIIRYDNSSTDNVWLYDEVITRGKNLYDGKIVR